MNHEITEKGIFTLYSAGDNPKMFKIYDYLADDYIIITKEDIEPLEELLAIIKDLC